MFVLSISLDSSGNEADGSRFSLSVLLVRLRFPGSLLIFLVALPNAAPKDAASLIALELPCCLLLLSPFLEEGFLRPIVLLDLLSARSEWVEPLSS